jgi:hypothetical protein
MKKPVIPAQAGISLLQCINGIPACAGMTPVFLVITKIYFNSTSKKLLTINILIFQFLTLISKKVFYR